MIFAILFGFLFSTACCAEMVQVPTDYPSITVALGQAGENDTIWVLPGTYPERLIFPAQDVVVMSSFSFTGDTSAIANTVIDASAFAASDTSSVLTFLHANSRATVVEGFTLTGGHGSAYAPNLKRGGCIYGEGASPQIRFCRITNNQARGGFVLYAQYGAPAVLHCEIFQNCGALLTVHVAGNNAFQDTTIFEWNDIHNNYECQNDIPYVQSNYVGVMFGNLTARFNRFHDYDGLDQLGVEIYGGHGEVTGNVFERLTTPEAGALIMVTDYAVPIRDNIFRDCALGNSPAIVLAHAPIYNPYCTPIEHNWFESLNSAVAPSCIFMQKPNAELRDNVFFHCRSEIGAVQFSQMSEQGCDVIFDRNTFFYNTAYGTAFIGSAFTSIGLGPPCNFTDNWFEGNEGQTVYFDSTISPQADLSNNYWGDPSGPFHPTENPGGQGDSVPANVHVTPWLTAPPGMSKSIEERLALNPEDWSLETAYPNPFNSTVHLRLTSAKPQPFEVTAYNTLGQKVSGVWQGVIPKDSPTLVSWNGTNDRQSSVASGIYYLVVAPKGPGARAPKSIKVVLLR